MFGVLAMNDSSVQLHGDRDKVEGRESVRHCDARDGHGIQGTKAILSAPLVVELKGRYSLRDDPRPCVDELLLLNEHKENKASIMDEAYVCLSSTIGAANGERHSVMRRYNSVALVEVQELQCLDGETVDETLMGGSGGKTEVAEIFGGGFGKGGIGAIKRRVKNCRIDVVERRVWGREKFVGREGRDGDVVRDELVLRPVTARLCRPNEISHSKCSTRSEDVVRIRAPPKTSRCLHGQLR